VKSKADAMTDLPIGAKRITTRVATFNCLASHRTKPGKPMARFFATGPTRIRRAIHRWNAAGITVVNLQELENDVAAEIQARPRWSVMRGKANDKLPHNNEIGNGIAFRDDVWTLVEASGVGVPISDGRTLDMPSVRLQHLETGLVLSNLCVHNPSRGPISGGTDDDRARAKAAEFAHADAQDGPVLVAGDFNEARVRNAFPGFEVAAASGVDLIFGKRITFDEPHVHRSFRKLLSDHPMVSVAVTVDGQLGDS
jgi:hypothetical protein